MVTFYIQSVALIRGQSLLREIMLYLHFGAVLKCDRESVYSYMCRGKPIFKEKGDEHKKLSPKNVSDFILSGRGC